MRKQVALGLLGAAVAVAVIWFCRPREWGGAEPHRQVKDHLGAGTAFETSRLPHAPFAVSPDGATVAVGASGAEIHFHDAKTGRLTGRLGPLAHPVSALAFAESGIRFFAGHGHTVSSWMWPECVPLSEVVTAHPQHGNQVVSSIHPSLDGRWAFVLFGSDPRIKAWDNPPSGRVLHLDFGSAAWATTDLTTNLFRPQPGPTIADDRILVNLPGSFEEAVGGVRVYDFATGKPVARSHPSFNYGAVALSRTGGIAGFRHKPPVPAGELTPGFDGGEVWSHPTHATIGSRRFVTTGGGVRWMQFARDGRTLVLAKYGGEFEFRDITTGQLLHSIPNRLQPDKPEPIRLDAISLSTTGTTLAASYADGLVASWDIATWLTPAAE